MTMKSVWLALAVLGAAGTVAACEEKSPAEEAADAVDDAARDVADEIKDATN